MKGLETKGKKRRNGDVILGLRTMAMDGRPSAQVDLKLNIYQIEAGV